MKTLPLTQGNILKSLLTFAVPVLLALFLQAMYGAADLLIVGRFAGTAEQSGVATGSQLFNLITMVVAGLSMGVTVFVGNAAGAGDAERAGKGIGTAAVLFTVIAVLITAAAVPASGALAAMMHAPADAFAQTSAYIRICGAGTVFIVAYNVLSAVLRSVGDSKTPLLTVAVACAVNIAGDLILVAGFGMGAAGAAIATVAAQGVSVACALYVLKRRGLPFAFSLRFFRPEGRCLRALLLVGAPIALQELLVQFSFLFIQIIVNDMGVAESAAVGVAEKVCVFLMLVSSAYMQSIAAFVAQNNGAGLPERSRRALVYGVRTALAAGFAMGLLAFFAGGALAAVFSKEQAVILAAHDYLRSYAIDCVLTAVLFCFVGYFNGCGRTLFVMIQGIAGAFCVRVPAVYLISRLSGVTLFHIGLATPLSSAVQIALCLIAYRYYRRRAAGDANFRRTDERGTR